MYFFCNLIDLSPKQIMHSLQKSLWLRSNTLCTQHKCSSVATPPAINIRNNPTRPELSIRFTNVRTATALTGALLSLFRCSLGLRRGRARTQVPTTRNCTVELPTFAVIAEVSQCVVQCKSLALKETPL